MTRGHSDSPNTPPAPPRKVLVAVLNFNSGGRVLSTIDSLLMQDYPALDLLVLDNASVDGSRETVQAAYPALPLVNTGANLGYCGGNNVAFEHGLSHGYDAVVIANHDIRVDSDAVSRMIRVLDRMPDAGVVGAQEVDGDTESHRVLGGRGYNFWRSRRQWISSPDALESAADVLPMDYVQGAFLLLSRAALERGIRLNEELFAYADEVDLGFQLARAGLKAYVDPAVRVQHTSLGSAYGAVEGYLTQRNRWYLVRHYGRPYHRIANLLLMILVELPVKAIVRTLQGQGRYARACLLGFSDGLRGVTGIGRIARL